MTSPLQLLAMIGTAAIATSGVACVALSAQSVPVTDPKAINCDEVDLSDPRLPREVAEHCSKVKRGTSPRGGNAPADTGTPQPCATCGRSSADEFRDPWLIGSANASGDGSGTSRLSGSALADLEQRIRNLENTSYFEVVSQKTQKTIFRVGPGGARFFNEAGVAVAAIGTTETGGFFTGRSTSGAEASIGASGARAGVRIGDSGLTRTELGTDAGPFGLRFPGGNGLIAGLGESRAGSGAVVVGTVAGVTQGSIAVSDSRPMVSLTKDAGPGSMAFAEATIGGGFLHVVMAGGQSAVKMGNNGGRYGIVLTGPILGVPYVPRTGVAGSYFVGCASGEKPACLPEAQQ
ncbi:MAG TPA: hypothetical protein VJS12_20210 [Steroidobacteraceae bacterium]|nr:hypothetical protein [Steroidobacteraceae bacterium]